MSLHLDHISLQSPDPNRLSDFYRRALKMNVEDLGVRRHCSAPNRHVLIAPGDSGLEFGAFVVNSLDQLAELRARISDTGCVIEDNPSPLFAADQAFAVTDPDGNSMVFGYRDRSVGDPGGNTLKARLQHVVVASDDIERLLGFYTEVVGFTLSDRVEDDDGQLTACFLRGDQEHHCFAIFSASEKRLDHHCYEVGEWALIRDWADHLASEEILLQWGPGRHGPGNNLFFMIHDPDKNWLEMSAELEVIEGERSVGIWQHDERTLNQWGRGLLRS